MSTSSCQKSAQTDEDVKDEFVAERENELFINARVLVKELAVGLCSPSLVDMAFHLDKKAVIIKVLKDVAKELEELEEDS